MSGLQVSLKQNKERKKKEGGGGQENTLNIQGTTKTAVVICWLNSLFTPPPPVGCGATEVICLGFVELFSTLMMSY